PLVRLYCFLSNILFSVRTFMIQSICHVCLYTQYDFEVCLCVCVCVCVCVYVGRGVVVGKCVCVCGRGIIENYRVEVWWMCVSATSVVCGSAEYGFVVGVECVRVCV